MNTEAPVFGGEYGGRQCWRHGWQGHPRQAAARNVDTQFVNRNAVPVEQLHVGGPLRRAHRGEVGHHRCGGRHPRHRRGDRRQGGEKDRETQSPR
ncbi:hypothetical protein L6Q96_15155 [Candidatus Binatia bacterium]|nr:hypothetical protein [Candidatus Binatia bacterium]